MRVERYTEGPGGNPDKLRVTDASGRVFLINVPMQPGGPLEYSDDDLASGIRRPWFFTGSPFGAEIVALYRERTSV